MISFAHKFAIQDSCMTNPSISFSWFDGRNLIREEENRNLPLQHLKF